MNDERIHLDLFSGIGGAALAADWVWPDIKHIFVEIDPFCQAVLRKHWPEAEIHGDIRTFTNSESPRWNHGASTDERATQREIHTFSHPPFLLTGGFPCQPFSHAGRRKGTDDNRHLWPEMLRVIREFRPRWVVGENVAGLLTIQQGVVFEQVCTDLEGEGYEVQPFVIPAVAVNAPHRRDRVWIVAHSGSERRQQESRSSPRYESKDEGGSAKNNHQFVGENKGPRDAQDPLSERSGRRLEGSGQVLGRGSAEVKNEGPGWEANWTEVATQLCGVDDGLPARMDGITISASRHRRERLKGLGNAWVPQVAYEIFKAIRAAEETKKDPLGREGKEEGMK